jgi:uncharacterized protein (TIGR00255 family)
MRVNGVILAAIRQALGELDIFRIQEGVSLYDDIFINITTICDLLEKIAPFESERATKVKERILEGLKELSSPEGVDHNRLEQEMIFYLEKLDINEEKIRLNNHCSYFSRHVPWMDPLVKNSDLSLRKLAVKSIRWGQKQITLKCRSL